MSRENESPITDSPWFWLMLFSAMGLLLLLVAGGQYGRRQARLELQYQARDRAAQQHDRIDADDATDSSDDRREFSSPANTIVPLWPLGVLLGVAATVSSFMLLRRHKSVAVEPDTDAETSREADS